LKLMDGVNPNTVWTWNAIGKRAGAWNLSVDSPEFTKGFLLNHLIGETLPAKDGDVWANADPITGQAACTICACASKSGAGRGRA